MIISWMIYNKKNVVIFEILIGIFLFEKNYYLLIIEDLNIL